LFVHLTVAGAVAAFTAGGIHDEETLGGAGGGIELDAAALEAKFAVHGVKDVAQSKFDLRGVRVEINAHRRGLRVRGGVQHARKSEKARAEVESSFHALIICQPRV